MYAKWAEIDDDTKDFLIKEAQRGAKLIMEDIEAMSDDERAEVRQCIISFFDDMDPADQAHLGRVLVVSITPKTVFTCTTSHNSHIQY